MQLEGSFEYEERVDEIEMEVLSSSGTDSGNSTAIQSQHSIAHNPSVTTDSAYSLDHIQDDETRSLNEQPSYNSQRY